MSTELLVTVEDDILIVESDSSTDIIEVATPGPQGPQGLSGSAASSYVHDQMTASTVWTINHNLGKFPTPNFFDSLDEEIEGSVHHVNNNQLTVLFTSAVSGKGYM